MLNGIFSSLYGTTVTVSAFVITSLISLVLGFGISFIYRKACKDSATLSDALMVLPFLVQLVIFLVNGNVGTGVAVAGAFGLVRFRSAPGSARDITAVFLAMTIGLACGMGYCALAALAAIVTGILFLIQGSSVSDPGEREIRVTVPENANYTDLFSDLFQQYTSASRLVRVKTVNMGSLYALHYQVKLKNPQDEKALLDAMRCRNGNLEISCGLPANDKKEELL